MGLKLWHKNLINEQNIKQCGEHLTETIIRYTERTQKRGLWSAIKNFHLSYLLKTISFSHDSISLAFSCQVKLDIWMLWYFTIIANEELLLSQHPGVQQSWPQVQVQAVDLLKAALQTELQLTISAMEIQTSITKACLPLHPFFKS